MEIEREAADDFINNYSKKTLLTLNEYYIREMKRSGGKHIINKCRY